MTSIAPRFDDYRNRYANIRLERDDGILVMTLHTEGREFVWSALAHEELGYCFTDVGSDRANKVVVLTGTLASMTREGLKARVAAKKRFSISLGLFR